MVTGISMSLLLLVVGGSLATAEEDSEAQRVEVPEAGLAMAFPGDWSVSIEMRPSEDFGLTDDPDAPPVAFWKVLYASAGGRPWCDVTWYPEHPLPLAEHALLLERLMTPSTGVERTIETSLVEVPAGESYRLDIHNAPTESFSSTYLLGPGSSRYILECMADAPDEDDWLSVAQTVELVEVMVAEQPEP